MSDIDSDALQQSFQINGSCNYDDTVTDPHNQTVAEDQESLEGDLNVIRTLLRILLGTTNWYDEPEMSIQEIADKFIPEPIHPAGFDGITVFGGSTTAFDTAIKTITDHFAGAGSPAATGVVVDATRSHVLHVRSSLTHDPIDDGAGNKVYARLSCAAGTYTTTFYSWINGIETSYTFSTPIDVDLGYVLVSRRYEDLRWDKFFDLEFQNTSISGSQGYQGDIGSQGYQGAGGGMAWSKIIGNTNAIRDNGYLISASADLILTLPVNPLEGDTIGIVDANGMATTYTLTVARNGSNIQGDASDLIIDTNRSGFTLSYVDAIDGWVIVSELTLGSGAGSSGSQGAQGPSGAQGAQGNSGSQGAQGNDGSQGSSGSQGSQGSQGSSGPQGSQGAHGPQGAQGNDGSQGPSGSQGSQGAQGNNGSQGSSGSQGAQGNDGSQGPSGSQGAQGAQGAHGPQGFQGSGSTEDFMQLQVWAFA